MSLKGEEKSPQITAKSRRNIEKCEVENFHSKAARIESSKNMSSICQNKQLYEITPDARDYRLHMQNMGLAESTIAAKRVKSEKFRKRNFCSRMALLRY
ncbi:MAG: hypothetical protein LBT05_16560 [Planctomycetaceae bacterium]|nr:hypothetical protein [Planctomycetaceae bacterium]